MVPAVTRETHAVCCEWPFSRNSTITLRSETSRKLSEKARLDFPRSFFSIFQNSAAMIFGLCTSVLEGWMAQRWSRVRGSRAVGLAGKPSISREFSTPVALPQEIRRDFEDGANDPHCLIFRVVHVHRAAGVNFARGHASVHAPRFTEHSALVRPLAVRAHLLIFGVEHS